MKKKLALVAIVCMGWIVVYATVAAPNSAPSAEVAEAQRRARLAALVAERAALVTRYRQALAGASAAMLGQDPAGPIVTVEERRSILQDIARVNAEIESLGGES